MHFSLSSKQKNMLESRGKKQTDELKDKKDEILEQIEELNWRINKKDYTWKWKPCMYRFGADMWRERTRDRSEACRGDEMSSSVERLDEGDMSWEMKVTTKWWERWSF